MENNGGSLTISYLFELNRVRRNHGFVDALAYDVGSTFVDLWTRFANSVEFLITQGPDGDLYRDGLERSILNRNRIREEYLLRGKEKRPNLPRPADAFFESDYLPKPV